MVLFYCHSTVYALHSSSQAPLVDKLCNINTYDWVLLIVIYLQIAPTDMLVGL